MAECAGYFDGYGLVVDPNDLEEDLTGFILGSTSQKQGKNHDREAGREEDAVAGEGDGEGNGSLDEGLGGFPKADEPQSKKRGRREDRVNESQEEAVTGEGEGFVDVGLGDSSKSDGSQMKQSRKRTRTDDGVNGSAEEKGTGEGEAVDGGLGDSQKSNGKAKGKASAKAPRKSRKKRYAWMAD